MSRVNLGGGGIFAGFLTPPGCSEGRVSDHFRTKVTYETPHILLVADPNPISKFILTPFCNLKRYLKIGHIKKMVNFGVFFSDRTPGLKTQPGVVQIRPIRHLKAPTPYFPTQKNIFYKNSSRITPRWFIPGICKNDDFGVFWWSNIIMTIILSRSRRDTYHETFESQTRYFSVPKKKNSSQITTCE